MSAMPLLLGILCVMAIAYRYYSAFLAAKVAVLDDSRQTPAHRLRDGHDYEPTNKWVLFGHHFAAISGAGPLIGPVLAAQFGYLPGLLWIVIGVCLAGAVQDFLVLVASVRRGGKSLAQIAFEEIGPVAGSAAMAAILFIVIISLAGLGKVVVKALGGEAVDYKAARIQLPTGTSPPSRGADGGYVIPPGATLEWADGQRLKLAEGFRFDASRPLVFVAGVAEVPAGSVRRMPGSAWGTFTIACTIPIALFIGFYMYRFRRGKVVEASIIGGTLTLGATVLGGWVAQHRLGAAFNLTEVQVILAMAIYGFIAAVLPVWVLLCPRDYLSSFLKVGTIALLVIGTLVANPKLQAPAFNHVFAGGGPIVVGKIFPFLFITIMCGAISGFHSLVSSGTTPKMLSKESQARMIGYGAMLMEGLVAVVAMIAAAALPVRDYYAMNTDLAIVPQYQDKILQVAGGGGVEHIGMYEQQMQESLRGRTGGAVTLAVGMAQIFQNAAGRLGAVGEAAGGLWKYWYHFAIMFEALFILTTIDAGTRIARFLLQEVAGKMVHPKLGRTDWWPGALLSTLVVVAAWSALLKWNNFAMIWGMFGVANQMLAAMALAVLTVVLVNEGKGRWMWVTAGPLVVVMTTTSTAAMQLLARHWTTIQTQWAKPLPDWNILGTSAVQGGLIAAVLGCAYVVVAAGAWRCRPRWVGVEAEVTR